MSRRRERIEIVIGEQDIGNGRILRGKFVGNEVYIEVLENEEVTQRNKIGRRVGNTLILENYIVGPGDGIKRPSIPCPMCADLMDHNPSFCTNWLPNGTYLCRQCKFPWMGTSGFVDKSPVSVPRGVVVLT